MLRRHVPFAAHVLVPLVAGGLFLLTGCPSSDTAAVKKPSTTAAAKSSHDDDHDHHDHDHGHHHHHHAENGPHSGALVAIGDDAAHLEFVLDAETGKLTAYVLDSAAEKPVAIKQSNLQLLYAPAKAGEHDDETDELPDDALPLMLAAVSLADDGTATEFAGQADNLKGVERFIAVVTTVNVAGKSHANVNFKYPEGNEEDHHH